MNGTERNEKLSALQRLRVSPLKKRVNWVGSGESKQEFGKQLKEIHEALVSTMTELYEIFNLHLHRFTPFAISYQCHLVRILNWMVNCLIITKI